MRRALATSLALLAMVPLLVACGGVRRHAPETPVAGSTPERSGRASFVFGDFGGLSTATLETNALPFKVAAAALLMAEEDRVGHALSRTDLAPLFARFGFLFPERIANWGDAGPPPFDRPLGLETGDVSVLPGLPIEVANLGCASCHSGALYDAAGHATHVAWLGMPNTSLNLEAYTQAAYQATRTAVRDPERLRRRIETLFPEAGRGERLMLRAFVLPTAVRRVAQIEAAGGHPLPFSNGGAGRTNGVGALKYQFGLLERDHYDATIGTVSIPMLGSRGLRSSLLCDGCYAPPGEARFAARDTAGDRAPHRDALAAIVAFFTVPIMGVKPGRAERSIPEAERVMAFLASAPPPPFPGAIDTALAGRGRLLFDSRCAACHGRYADGPPPCRPLSFPNRLVLQAEMNTDAARWQAIDTPLAARLEAGTFGRHVDVAGTGGYVAAILSGLWATAPYLHNGSVPTLWHLMHPADRPVRFEQGGHALDYERVGIAGVRGADGVYRYPPGFAPWCAPEIYDTRAPGLSNRGHEREFEALSEEEKRALIEFLKCL
jgi:mono/diheme cytochrome c family protein